MDENNAIVINDSDEPDADLEEKAASSKALRTDGDLTVQHRRQVDPSQTMASTSSTAQKRSFSSLQSSSKLTTASAPQSRGRFVRAQWPINIVHLRSNYNPDGIMLPRTQTFGSCGCDSVCRHHTCRNARLGVFCTTNCCPYRGECGNALIESKSVVLARDTELKAHTVLATQAIPRGTVIGEYLGRITLDRPSKDRVRNRGYKLMMREGPKGCGIWRACIDAETFGGLMRFVNHSCRPSAAFYEVANGSTHAIAVAVLRDIQAGEEITVDYGRNLWFVCRCGEDNCCHRDIQHLSDP